jgi:iron complex transport system ATP-binding protein
MLELKEFRLLNSKNLEGADFFASGLTCLLGLNGCGKTTLLRTIAGFNPHYSGDIYLDKVRLPHCPLKRSSILSWCPERLEMPFSYQVIDIVLLGRFPIHRGSPSRSDLNSCYGILEKVGALSLADKDVREISSGEFRKIMVARALSQETPLLLFDEPTANLDPQAAEEIITLLKEIAKEKIVIVSMHDLRLAYHFANRLWLMKDLTISDCLDSPKELTSELLRTYFKVNYAIHADFGPIQLLN